MAACHLRSISLPSRSHPLIVAAEEQFYKLKASQSSSMSYELNGLKNLFERIDDLLQLPQAQQTLSHERQSQCVENALDGSLELLDLCDSTRDFFAQMKECVQELELYLRRREGKDSGTTIEVDAYMLKAKSKPSGWSIITKALQSKRISCEVEIEVNEVEKIDAELLILKSSKDISISQLQNLLKGLKALDSSIQEAEEELECIYRQLVKTRVSLLNILNH
ncbi:hypothetical protein GH714_014738 [Hevea brasiliensis]|uniref:Uncharacterized protein n=1 Tax=Hevea brasiliensis TaxID=3981 RepID=A0A6A6K669_HEVBR|nr:hypothetical protein GH714_014738 [Hevea brasiliensis]